jgi:hypothetical protein
MVEIFHPRSIDSHQDQFWSDFWNFDLNTLKWVMLKDSSYTSRYIGIMRVPDPRNYLGQRRDAVCWTDVISGYLYMYGGKIKPDSDSWSTVNDVWMYNVASNIWTWIAGTSIQALQEYHIPVSSVDAPTRVNAKFDYLDDGTMYMFGGFNEQHKPTSDVYRFDTSNHSWTLLTEYSGACPASSLYPIRSAQAWCIWSDHTFLMNGGTDGEDWNWGREIEYYAYQDLWHFDSISKQSEFHLPTPGLGVINGSLTRGAVNSGAFSRTAFGLFSVGGTVKSQFKYYPINTNDLWTLSVCNSVEYMDQNMCTCSKCATGKVATTDSQGCVDCPPGTYRDEYSKSCKKCPSNTMLIEGSTACLCMDGFLFSNDLCDSCQGYAGIQCPMRNLSYPIVLPGYFPNTENEFFPFLLRPRSACPGVEVRSPNQSYCGEMYDGFQCLFCRKGAYRSGKGDCVRCPGMTFLIVEVLLFILFLAFIIYQIVIRPNSVSIADVLSGTGGVSSTFANLSRILNQFFGFLNFTNFNFEMFSPECFVQFGFWKKVLIKLCTPLFVFMLASCLVLIKKRHSSNRNQEIRFQHHLFEIVASISSAMFTLQVASFSEPFDCHKDDNGVYFLKSDSSVTCFNEEWGGQIVHVIGFGDFLFDFVAFRAFLDCLEPEKKYSEQSSS